MVAERCQTHPLDEEITSLTQTQLILICEQIKKDKKKKRDDDVSLIKNMNEVWMKYFKNQFESLQIFTNPEMYKKVMEQKEIKEYQDEISADDFAEEWEKMMEVLPDSVTVTDEKEGDPFENLPKLSPEQEEMLSGWIPNKEEGDSDGNG